MKTKLLLIGIFIFLSNFYPSRLPFILLFDKGHYRYSNIDGAYTFTNGILKEVSPGNTIKVGFENFLAQNNNPDRQLYRLFTKNPFAFWRWYEYFFSEEYELPYKNWEDIEKKYRPLKTEPTKWQDF